LAAISAFGADYEISLSETGTYYFPDRSTGYSQVAARTVTVWNTGNYSTGSLDIYISGSDSDCFVLSTSRLSSISRNDSRTFTIRPITGLSRGTYYATVEVYGSNGISERFEVSFAVGQSSSSSWSYDVRLSETGTYNFAERDVGYSQITGRRVTVTNEGNQATGRLDVDIFGPDAGSFVLSTYQLSSIPRNGTGSFTVRPETGLAAGVYFATVAVSGGDGIYAWFNVSFSVGRSAQSVGITLSQTGTHTFAERDEGYNRVAARTITVRNNRNQATGILNVDLYGRDSGDFVLSTNRISSIARNGSSTFTIRPADGLGAGSYFATVEVSGSDGIFASFNVSFTVMYDGWWPDNNWWWDNDNRWDSGNWWSGSDINFTSGNTYVVDSRAPFIVDVRRDFQQFRSLSVNNVTLARNDHYTVRSISGFTEITFNGNYMNTLTIGAHNLSVRFSDRTVSATFSVSRTAGGGSFQGGLSTAAVADSLRVRPNEFVTQGDAVEALHRIAGSPTVVSMQGRPLFGRDAAYTWAASNGIMPVSGEYNLDGYMTRQDVAFILSRLADAQRLRLRSIRGAYSFTDSWSIDDRARMAVNELYMAGVLNGRTSGAFDPWSYMTRAEMATVLQRFGEAVN